jgi:acetoin utilization deacetylase AcuC-like enzyme
VFLPALGAFKPDLLIISAGFDAFEADPLAGMRVTHAGFAAMARRLRRAADSSAGGRLVAVLEGGYDLDGLSGGMTAVLRELTAPSVTAESIAPLPPDNRLQRAAIEGTLRAHANAGLPIPEPTP